MVGSEARIRVSSVIAPASFSGTLKSTRMKTRLPRRSMSRMVSLAILVGRRRGSMRFPSPPAPPPQGGRGDQIRDYNPLPSRERVARKRRVRGRGSSPRARALGYKDFAPCGNPRSICSNLRSSSNKAHGAKTVPWLPLIRGVKVLVRCRKGRAFPHSRAAKPLRPERSVSACTLQPGRDVLDQVADAARVSPLVVVPSRHLDTVRSDDLGKSRVDDGGARIAAEVDGDQFVGRELQDAAQRAFCRLAQ